MLDLSQTIDLSLVLDGDHRVFPSRVEALDAATIRVALPRRDGHPLLLEQEQPVVVSFPRYDAVYSFESRVRGVDGGQIVIERPRSDKIRRLQRRDFMRAATTLPLRLRVKGQEAEGVVRNLSVGGCQISSSLPLQVGEELQLRFALGEEREPLQLEARVLWCERGEAEPVYGLQFLRPSPATREALARHVEGQAAGGGGG